MPQQYLFIPARLEFTKAYDAPYTQAFLDWAEKLKESKVFENIEAVITDDRDKGPQILKDAIVDAYIKRVGRAGSFRPEDFVLVYARNEITDGRVYAGVACVMYAPFSRQGA